jgi:hypothetical protein
MSRYNRVSPNYWHLCREWNERTTIVGLYVQTCRHRHSEGLYHIPREYIAGDLGYTAHAVNRSLYIIENAGFVRYDRGANVLLLMTGLELQPPTSPRQIKGAIDRLRTLPASPLLRDLYFLARSHSNGLADSIAMEFPESIAMGNGFPFESSSPSPSPSSYVEEIND